MKNFFLTLGCSLLLAQLSFAQYVDTNFNPAIAGVPEVYAHEVQSDGKILLSGNFIKFENQSVGSVIRVNEDGTLDESFTISDDIGNTIIDRIEEISADYILVSSRNQGGSWVLNSDGSLKTDIDKALKTDNDYAYTLGAFVLDEKSLLVRKDGNKKEFIKVDLDGIIDTEFNRTFLPNQDRPKDIAIQNDGKIIVIGYHYPIVGDSQYGLVRRFNKDGKEDNAFNIGTGPGQSEITQVEIDSEGKIYLVGYFDSFNNIPVPNRIVRLQENGAIDNSFILEKNEVYGNLYVVDIEIMQDGSIILMATSEKAKALVHLKINEKGDIQESYLQTKLFPKTTFARMSKHAKNTIVSGVFHRANDQDKYGIVWINENGSLNKEFDLPIGSMAHINSTILEDDGKILIGGQFSSVKNINQLSHLNSKPEEDVLKLKNMARLNSDGTFDDFISPFEHDNRVESIVQQKDGKYLVSGQFRSIGKEGLVRLNNNGTIDDSFKVNYFGQGSTVKLTNDNHIIIGGLFHSVNGIMRNGLAKIDPEGNVVESFNAINILPDSYTVQAIYSLNDGSQLIGGYYGSSLSGFVWKIDKNASTILFELNELPYYVVSNFLELEDRILVSGGSGNPPCPVLQIDFDGNIMEQTSFSLSYSDPHIFGYSLLKDNDILIGGRFDKTNGSTHVGLAKASLTGIVDENFRLDLDGHRASVLNIVPASPDSAYISGIFKGINGIMLNGIAKIKLPEISHPKIVSQVQFPEIEEDSNFSISLETLEITRNFDPEIEKTSTNPLYNNKLFELIILNGNNYEVNGEQITPDANVNGAIEVNIKVKDDELESDQFSYLINITPVNDPPTINEQVETPTFLKGEYFQIEQDIFTIKDPEDDELQIVILDGDDYDVSNQSIKVAESYSKNSIQVNVIATDGELSSEVFSSAILLEDPPILSVEISDTQNPFRVYPIPCNAFLNLEYSGVTAKKQITINDLSGKAIFTREFNGFSNNETINTSKFQKGIYFLTIRNGNRTFTKKIIKN